MTAFILFFAAMVIAITTPAPALAVAAPETIALGVFRADDNRVLQIGGDGSSSSSPIVIAPYQQGTTLAARQQWRLERRAAGSGIPDYTYRIVNPASGRCLNASGSAAANGAALILYACQTGTNSYWYMPSSPSPFGVRLISLRDNRCVDIPSGATGNNVALHVWNCNDDDAAAWNQMWAPRTGQDRSCSIRTGDWQGMTRLCVNPVTVVRAAMASWHHHPAGLSWRDPADGYVLSNEMRSYLTATFANNGGAFEFGWRSRRSDTPTGSMTYASYWINNPDTGQDYYEVPATDPWNSLNGSTVADGTQHTYLSVAADDAAGWNLYFDYNLVGRTSGPSNARAVATELGTVTRYLNATGFTAPYEFRTQIMDLTGVWRRPAETETTTANPKTCDQFPIWDDFSQGQGLNREPWCWTNVRTFTGTPAALDKYTVDKSAVTSVAAAPAAKAAAQATVVNGVDQEILADCLRQNATECMQTVPGLAACVQAGKNCNHTSASTLSQKTVAPTHNQLEEKAMLAVGADRADGAVTGQLTTVRQASQQFAGLTAVPDLAAEQQVFVVTGTHRVHGFGQRTGTTFTGWSAVLDPATGQLLYVHLGATN